MNLAKVLKKIQYKLFCGIKRQQSRGAFRQFSLGRMYFNGLGVVKDKIQAFHWTEKAAKQGHDSTQSFLSNFCFLGIGTKKNREKGMYWFVKYNQNRSEKGKNNDVVWDEVFWGDVFKSYKGWRNYINYFHKLYSG